MTLDEAIAARYARQAAEQAAASKPRTPDTPEPASLRAAVEGTLRDRPDVIWPGDAPNTSAAAPA